MISQLMLDQKLSFEASIQEWKERCDSEQKRREAIEKQASDADGKVADLLAQVEQLREQIGRQHTQITHLDREFGSATGSGQKAPVVGSHDPTNAVENQDTVRNTFNVDTGTFAPPFFEERRCASQIWESYVGI